MYFPKRKQKTLIVQSACFGPFYEDADERYYAEEAYSTRTTEKLHKRHRCDKTQRDIPKAPQKIRALVTA